MQHTLDVFLVELAGDRPELTMAVTRHSARCFGTLVGLVIEELA
jgi:hypothetical protein